MLINPREFDSIEDKVKEQNKIFVKERRDCFYRFIKIIVFLILIPVAVHFYDEIEIQRFISDF